MPTKQQKYLVLNSTTTKMCHAAYYIISDDRMQKQYTLNAKKPVLRGENKNLFKNFFLTIIQKW